MNIENELNRLKEFIMHIHQGKFEYINEAISISEYFVKLSKETYNLIANKYDQLHPDVSKLEEKLWEKLIVHIKNVINLSDFNNLKLLDIGAGTGKDMIYAHNKYNFDVYGIDNSEIFFEVISKKSDVGIIPQNRIYYADMRDLAIFQDDNFDIVRHNATLLHLPVICEGTMVDKALSESVRVLKKNGILFLMVKKGNSIQMVDTKEGIGKRFFQFFTIPLLTEVLQRNGLEIIEIDEEMGDLNTIWIFSFCKKK